MSVSPAGFVAVSGDLLRDGAKAAPVASAHHESQSSDSYPAHVQMTTICSSRLPSANYTSSENPCVHPTDSLPVPLKRFETVPVTTSNGAILLVDVHLQVQHQSPGQQHRTRTIGERVAERGISTRCAIEQPILGRRARQGDGLGLEHAPAVAVEICGQRTWDVRTTCGKYFDSNQVSSIQHYPSIHAAQHNGGCIAILRNLIAECRASDGDCRAHLVAVHPPRCSCVVPPSSSSPPPVGHKHSGNIRDKRWEIKQEALDRSAHGAWRFRSQHAMRVLMYKAALLRSTMQNPATILLHLVLRLHVERQLRWHVGKSARHISCCCCIAEAAPNLPLLQRLLMLGRYWRHRGLHCHRWHL